MATRDEAGGLPIGEVLKRTRTRHKIDIRTVEQQTKIRIKYLRALENEEWDVLPGPAYAKGFLRTYAQFLGLDGDALVDEYRRTVEAALDADRAFGFSEPVLERRRRPGEEPRRGWPVRASLVAAGAAVVAVLLVLGLAGSERGQGRPAPEGQAAECPAWKRGRLQPGRPCPTGDRVADHARLDGGLPGDRRRASADRRADAELGRRGGPLPAAGRQLPPGPVRRAGRSP